MLASSPRLDVKRRRCEGDRIGRSSMNTPLRLHHPVWLLLIWAGLTWSSASATTEGETALINSPLPHEKLGVGREPMRVHWVRMQGYFEGKQGHAAMLDELKADVQSC